MYFQFVAATIVLCLIFYFTTNMRTLELIPVFKTISELVSVPIGEDSNKRAQHTTKAGSHFAVAARLGNGVARVRCEANEFAQSANDYFAFLHEDTAGVLCHTATGEVIGRTADHVLRSDGGNARGEVGGDGQNGEGRTLVGTAVPEGELVVAVVHFVGGDTVFVHVGVGGTALAEVVRVGETPNSRIALGNGSYGLQGGKGATAFVVAHIGGRGEDIARAGCEVVDAKAFGVVAHEAPELFPIFGIYFGVGELEGLLRAVGFEDVALLADLHGVPL